VRALSPAVRAAIVLRHVDGLTVAETAEALGRPQGTIKAQVHRGLLELRRAVEAGPQQPPGISTNPRTATRAARLRPALEAVR
jgi:DNA-directed RNA polymerase specialized sigma24 family protein